MNVPPAIETAMHRAVATGVFPGAILAVRRRGSPALFASVGRLSIDPPGGPVSSSTIYDLASLTKPLATVTSLALLVHEGRCRLDDHVHMVLPELRDVPVGSSTLRDLLTHSSGLPGWRAFYERLCPNAHPPSSPEARRVAGGQLLQLIKEEPLIYARGERSLYSDLGFMLLGLIIERLTGKALDRYVVDHITKPLGALELQYRPANQANENPNTLMPVAPTEFDSWRNRLLCGEVHDENAAALGGVAGHAGLFGTAESILLLTGAWLDAHHRRPSLLDSDVVLEFTRRQERVPGSSWALGWDTPSTPSSSGRYFSSQSFGHLGYTGTSIWIDPVRGLEVVLLSNRVHPSRRNDAIRSFRPAIHDLVCREFAAEV